MCLTPGVVPVSGPPRCRAPVASSQTEALPRHGSQAGCETCVPRRTSSSAHSGVKASWAEWIQRVLTASAHALLPTRLLGRLRPRSGVHPGAGRIGDPGSGLQGSGSDGRGARTWPRPRSGAEPLTVVSGSGQGSSSYFRAVSVARPYGADGQSAQDPWLNPARLQ